MTNAETLRRLRERAAADGRCYVCRCRPAKAGRRTCQACLDRVAAKKAAQRYVKCQSCSASVVERGTLYCDACTAAGTARDARRRDRLTARGLCCRCGRTPYYGDSLLCFGCLERMRLNTLTENRLRGVRAGTRACTICVALGLAGLNHNRRTHDRYMALARSWQSEAA